MKTENLVKSGVAVLSTVAGSMASRVVGNQIPITNTKVKYGVLIAGSLLAVAVLDRKDTTEKMLQDVAIGFSAVQLGNLAKEVAGASVDGVLKTALGNPYRNSRALRHRKHDFLANPNYDMIPSGMVRKVAPQVETVATFES